jgi:hypothetical protein
VYDDDGGGGGAWGMGNYIFSYKPLGHGHFSVFFNPLR